MRPTRPEAGFSGDEIEVTPEMMGAGQARLSSNAMHLPHLGRGWCRSTLWASKGRCRRGAAPGLGLLVRRELLRAGRT